MNNLKFSARLYFSKSICQYSKYNRTLIKRPNAKDIIINCSSVYKGINRTIWKEIVDKPNECWVAKLHNPIRKTFIYSTFKTKELGSSDDFIKKIATIAYFTVKKSCRPGWIQNKTSGFEFSPIGIVTLQKKSFKLSNEENDFFVDFEFLAKMSILFKRKFEICSQAHLNLDTFQSAAETETSYIFNVNMVCLHLKLIYICI